MSQARTPISRQTTDYVPSPPAGVPISETSEGGPGNALARAAYFELVRERLGLSAQELALLQCNGFVVSDRLAFADCSTAYAYFYWQDLPVLITTDSLLHALHATYDDLLSHLEAQMLAPHLTAILRGVHNTLQAAADENDDPMLAPLYQDVLTYVSVPLHLLGRVERPTLPDVLTEYLKFAMTADSASSVELFGSWRLVDWTQFAPRGHYARDEYPQLGNYFRAMMWLAQIDFRLVAFDPAGRPHLQRGDLAAATLLRDAIRDAGERPQWEAFDALFGALIGRSDNMTLCDLDQFLEEAHLADAAAILEYPAPEELLRQLTTHAEYQQRITGQLLFARRDLDTSAPRPISLMLLGQRFAVDSYIMSNLVFDRLRVNGQKVERGLPSPLDVLYVLGSDRAAIHLEAELTHYHYSDELVALRAEVAAYPAAFWESTLYTRFLNMLRTLHSLPGDATAPPTFRSTAWADKMLHTQLAAWSQARHDSLLYIKHSYTGIPLCTYPAGYVEPYPAFYAAMAEYAAAGQALMEGLPARMVTQSPRVHTQARQYFGHLRTVAERLEVMAEKALREEPWSAEEAEFVKTTAVRTSEWFDPVCARIMERVEWAGWYPQLFRLGGGESDPAVIADIHTNPARAGQLAPPRVLHVGSGQVATLVMLIETADGPALYVGPALTYYEVVEEGWPPVRLNDEMWRERLRSTPRPEPPLWTTSFRLAAVDPPQDLHLPPPAGSPEQARGRRRR